MLPRAGPQPWRESQEEGERQCTTHGPQPTVALPRLEHIWGKTHWPSIPPSEAAPTGHAGKAGDARHAFIGVHCKMLSAELHCLVQRPLGQAAHLCRVGNLQMEMAV